MRPRDISLVVLAVMVTVIVLILGFAVSGCSSGVVTMSVVPSSSLADAAAAIRVAGLAAGSEASIAVDATDASSRSWRSAASFTADSEGSVDTATAAPQAGGSYGGVFADGLIAMMRPTDGATPGVFRFPTSGAIQLRFTATVAGREVAATTQQRSVNPSGVAVETLRSPAHGFDGVFAHPVVPLTGGVATRPAVLLLGGSEGGNSMVLNARLLAAHGVSALALAYFNTPSRPTEFPALPKDLKDVPLEYFRTALRWLAAQPGINPEAVRVYGVSRGSEAAILSGIHFPDLVHGVAAIVPTNAARPAQLANNGQPRADLRHSAWTLHGKEIPWTNTTATDPADRPAALFKVEKINGPILTVCGDVDQLWDSCPFSRQIMTRLADEKFGFPRQLLSYHDAGHHVSLPANLPYVPDPNGLPGYGNTEQANS